VLHKQQQLSHLCVSMSVIEQAACARNLGVQRGRETWTPFTGLQPDSAAPLESGRADPNVRGALLLDLNVHVRLIVCYEAALHSDDLHSAASCLQWKASPKPPRCVTNGASDAFHMDGYNSPSSPRQTQAGVPVLRTCTGSCKAKIGSQVQPEQCSTLW